MLLDDLYQGVDFDSFKGIKKASKREDHEYHMARKQLMAAKEAIEDILDAMGDEEEGDISLDELQDEEEAGEDVDGVEGEVDVVSLLEDDTDEE